MNRLGEIRFERLEVPCPFKHPDLPGFAHREEQPEKGRRETGHDRREADRAVEKPAARSAKACEDAGMATQGDHRHDGHKHAAHIGMHMFPDAAGYIPR